jgi:hypothetical protein
MSEDNIEIEKLKLENEIVQLELQIKKKEAELKQKELDLLKNEPKQSFLKYTPTQTTIIVAILGILGSVLLATLQEYSNQKLEKAKFESELVLKVGTSDSLEQNKRNLKFLLNTGLLTDLDGKIRKGVEDSNFSFKIVNPIVENINPNQSVYICRGPDAQVYHLSAKCRGLSQCSSQIDLINLDSALKLGRRPCKICN